LLAEGLEVSKVEILLFRLVEQRFRAKLKLLDLWLSGLPHVFLGIHVPRQFKKSAIARRFFLLRAKSVGGGGAEPPKKRAAPLRRSRPELHGFIGSRWVDPRQGGRVSYTLALSVRVVRVSWPCVTRRRGCLVQASKSSSNEAMADGSASGASGVVGTDFVNRPLRITSSRSRRQPRGPGTAILQAKSVGAPSAIFLPVCVISVTYVRQC
jgi:hypothetical protein